MKQYIDSDEYFQNKGKYDKMSREWGMEFSPVTAHEALVTTSKYDKSNLKNTQENILDRFGLGTDLDESDRG